MTPRTRCTNLTHPLLPPPRRAQVRDLNIHLRPQPLVLLFQLCSALQVHLGADRAQLWLLHRPAAALVRADVGSGDAQHRAVPLEPRSAALASVAGSVALSAKPEAVDDMYMDSRVDADADAAEHYHTHALAAVPLVVRGRDADASGPTVRVDETMVDAVLDANRLQVVGVIVLQNRVEPPYHFNARALAAAAAACELLEATLAFARPELERLALEVAPIDDDGSKIVAALSSSRPADGSDADSGEH